MTIISIKNKLSKTYLLALAVGMFFFFASCKFNSDMQSEGASFLQGEWVQDSIAGQQQMLQYTLHEFKFTCDSIYTVLHVNNKVQTIPDSCYKNGSWTERAKGIYVLRGDSVIVDGIFTKENGKQKISGCYRSGQYIPRFKVVYHDPDSVVLESRFDQRPIILRKVKDISCVPKKRY
ncbi:fumarate hydratase [Sphingobacterium thalpophilum]|nr:fumarate hydratase [Sphingobacterium thalpophilum]MCW8312346.1 fumarate hydratase [Sphingobacterium sp. InxBP1]